jgi:hypothetical protein
MLFGRLIHSSPSISKKQPSASSKYWLVNCISTRGKSRTRCFDKSWGNDWLLYSRSISISEKIAESLRQAVTKLSNRLAEKGLTEDDIATDFQELRKQSNL